MLCNCSLHQTLLDYIKGILEQPNGETGELKKQLDELLPVLRRAGAGPECLKAVLTPHNRSWNAVMLYGELLREHKEMQGK